MVCWYQSGALNVVFGAVIIPDEQRLTAVTSDGHAGSHAGPEEIKSAGYAAWGREEQKTSDLRGPCL